MTAITREKLPRQLVIAFWIALSTMFFVLPVSGTTAVRYLAFVTLLATTVLLLIRQRKMPELPFGNYWLAYLLIGLLSVAYAVDPEMSWGELRVEVVYLIAIFLVGATWGRQMSSFSHIVLVLAIANCALSMMAFQKVSLGMPLDEVMRVNRFAYAGMDGNWLLIVMFLEGWLATELWRTGRRGYSIPILALIALDVWAMLATQNRQNFVSLGAGLCAVAVLLLWYRFTWRRLAVLAGLISIALALVTVQIGRRTDRPTQAPVSPDVATSIEKLSRSVPNDVRLELWKFSLQKIADHPFIGGGIGRGVFDKLYPEFMPENWALWHAHNMIINKGVQMGIPGMLAFGGLWLALTLELLHHSRRSEFSRPLAIAGIAATTAIFMKNMTDDFFVRNVALQFWLVMGLLVGYLREQARREALQEKDNGNI